MPDFLLLDPHSGPPRMDFCNAAETLIPELFVTRLGSNSSHLSIHLCTNSKANKSPREKEFLTL